MSILIQNGVLVLPDGPQRADLRVDGDKIVQLGPSLPAGDSRVLDAAGKLVFPGLIDTHTHFEMNKGLANETADDWFTGTRAALAGGTTTVLDFAEPERGCSLASALETWHGRADGKACCHYGFHMTIKDWDPRIRSELRDMTAAGVTSYKVYLAYDNLRLSDAAAYQVIQAVGREGGVLGCHCENGDLVNAGIRAQKAAGRLGPSAHPRSRPPAVEAEAVNRWLAIAECAGYPVNVVHLSTRRGLEHALAARERGQKVYLETCLVSSAGRELLQPCPALSRPSTSFPLPPGLSGRPAGPVAELWSGGTSTPGHRPLLLRLPRGEGSWKGRLSKIPNSLPWVEHRPACSIPTLWPQGASRPQTWPGCWRKIPPGSSACTPKGGPGGGQRCRYRNF